jgi:hypothetical protein
MLRELSSYPRQNGLAVALREIGQIELSPAGDFGRRRLDRALLTRQEVLLDRLQDNLLDGGFEPAFPPDHRPVCRATATRAARSRDTCAPSG